MNKINIPLNKPIYVGVSILDYAKLFMYEFYYNKINTVWNNNMLHYTDNDSLIFSVKTENIYKDLEKIKDDLDTSKYPTDHPLYSKSNEMIIGKMKDETKGKIISEAVFLRSKEYSIKTNNIEKNVIKGVTEECMKKIKFDDLKKAVLNSSNDIKKIEMDYITKDGKKKINKQILNPYDDKIYLIDNIKVRPLGNY